MVNLAILGATIVTMDSHKRVIKNGGIAIDEGRVIDVGSLDEIKSRHNADRVIDAHNMIAMPGLINAHTHMFQVLVRGLGDDMELMKWINSMMSHVVREVTPEVGRVGALLGCLEMIKTGTSFVVDNHHGYPTEETVDQVASSIQKSGMRGIVARGIISPNTMGDKMGIDRRIFRFTPDEEIRITRKLMQKWNGMKDGTVRICPAPGAIFGCSEELFIESKRLSDEFQVPIHTHIAESRIPAEAIAKEFGLREVEWLAKIGVLGPRFHVVHGVWLSDNEVKTLAERGGHLIHCPVSNMYLASGVSPVPKVLKAGGNVALATDGPASNNNQDMIGVLKATALLHKVSTLDPEIISCDKVLEMATIGGAKAIGLENELGSIEKGKRADIALINSSAPHMAPVHKPVSAIVYCSLGSDVDTMIIDGRIVMENRVVKTLDEEAVIQEAKIVAGKLIERSGITHLLN